MGNAARQRGFTRWGFKEVRLGAADCNASPLALSKGKIHTADQESPMIVIFRCPIRGGSKLYHRRPDIRIDSAAGLARHWNRLALSWSELSSEFPAYRIKYEDIVARQS